MGRVVCAVVVVAAAALAGCESTQDKSARLARAAGAHKARSERGLVVRERSRAVVAGRATVLRDAGGAAVVVELRNRSRRALAQVPVSVSVRGRGRQVLYANDTAGLDASLVRAPLVPAGARLLWVNDQATIGARPTRTRVAVGAGARPVAGAPPRIQVSGVRLEGDPAGGITATGRVANRSRVEQRRLIVFAVALRGRRVVAAGRAIVQRLRTGRTARFTAFFVGNPRGAKLDVAAPPTVLRP